MGRQGQAAAGAPDSWLERLTCGDSPPCEVLSGPLLLRLNRVTGHLSDLSLRPSWSREPGAWRQRLAGPRGAHGRPPATPHARPCPSRCLHATLPSFRTTRGPLPRKGRAHSCRGPQAIGLRGRGRTCCPPRVPGPRTGPPHLLASERHVSFVLSEVGASPQGPHVPSPGQGRALRRTSGKKFLEWPVEGERAPPEAR